MKNKRHPRRRSNLSFKRAHLNGWLSGKAPDSAQRKRALAGRTTRTGPVNNVLLFLFLFFLPTQLGKHFFLPFSYLSGLRIDYLAPTLYLTDILAVSLIVVNLKAVIDFFKNKSLLIILGLLAIHVFTIGVRGISVYHYFKILELISVFAIFYRSKINEGLILFGFFSAAVLETSLAILQFINKQSLQGIFYFLGERYINLSLPDVAKGSINDVEILRPYGTFSHPNSMGGFYILVYTFFLLAPRSPEGEVGLIKKILLLLCSILTFLSFSKVAIITFLIINILYLLKTKPFRDCLVCNISKIVTLIVLGLVFLQAKSDPLSLQKRLSLTAQSFNIIGKHIFWGVGLGNYLVLQNKIASNYLFYSPQPVHNIFLLFFSEVGLILGLMILFFLGQFLLTQRKNLLLVTCFLVLFLTGLFDHYWLTLQQNWLLMGVVLGFTLSERSKSKG